MSELSPINLPKAIFNRAVELGVKSITLNFRGGNDEGYLDVFIVEKKDQKQLKPAERKEGIYGLEMEIQKWADDAYDYSGAGDGTEYGDDVTYDLENMKASTSSWCMERVDGEETTGIDFKAEDDEDE
jgi:hypothetical protein